MKRNFANYSLAALVVLCVTSAVVLPACVSPTAAGAPTAAQQTIANAVEDAISIGLVPVLTKNPSYAAAASTVAAALGSFSGSTLTPADVDAFLARVPALSPPDRSAIAGIVNAAWGVYVKRYQQAAGASVRPDVKLFLAAVADGISSAVAAVPRS